MKRTDRWNAAGFAAACGLAALALSCSDGGMTAFEAQLADMASAVSAYDLSRSLDAAAELDDGIDPTLAADAAARGTDEFAEATRLVEDLGDGRERITRTWTRWNGVDMKSVAVRMKAPAADDPRWADGDIVDAEATEEIWVGDLTRSVSVAELTIAWRNEAGTVFVATVLREGERIRSNGDFVRTFTERDSLGRVIARRVEYLRIGQTVAEHTITYSYAWSDGELPDEIRMEVDGVEGYALVLSLRDPRVVEWYRDLDGDGDDELSLRVEKVRDPATGELVISRTPYAADGSAGDTTMVRARIRVEDGKITVVRTREDGSVYRVTVAETAEGYVIDRNGTAFTVVVREDGSLLVTGEVATWLAERSADGSWIVTRL